MYKQLIDNSTVFSLPVDPSHAVDHVGDPAFHLAWPWNQVECSAKWKQNQRPRANRRKEWFLSILLSAIVTMGILYLTLKLFSLIIGWLSIPSGAGIVSLPSYPLAVKGPYLSAWLPGAQSRNAATAQPEFWTHEPLTWTVLARVDDVTYTLFGNPQEISNATAAVTNSVSYTSSHTYLQLAAGAADITLDFFSPVLPGKAEYARHSLPYSYLTVCARGSDGNRPRVQILSAIDHSWTAQDGSIINLNYTSSGDAGFFWFYNPDAISFVQTKAEMAPYGSVIYGSLHNSQATHACGPASRIYNAFSQAGSSAISKSSQDCLGSDLAALSSDLGLGGEKHERVTFAIGLDRVEVIDYLGNTQTGYYRTKWPTVPEAIEYVLDDYDDTLSHSLDFDAEMRSRAEAVSRTFGGKYADIVEASVRQTYGGMELTVPLDDMTASPMAFLKEISTDGNVNTIDFIFQSWPIFISINPEYIKLLLEPVLSYLASGRWPHDYVIHDIGSDYPNATGHNDGIAEYLPLFETSALFIMMYAYQELTGDTSFTQKYSSLLEPYAKYLAPVSLYPFSQQISVDSIQAMANETGLAIQSAIGLNAASILTGNDTYATVARSNAKAIYNDGLGLNGASPQESTHFTFTYGNDTTWNVMFPAYSDVVLNLSTFPQEAWDLQSTWYITQFKELGLPFAGPVDDLNYTTFPLNWGLTDWNIVAASVSSVAVQQAVIDTTHAFLTNGMNDVQFGTRYYVEGPDVGKWLADQNRAIGGHFALLALDQGTWYT